MQLQSLKYSEFESQDNAWSLVGLQLGQRNLIVGKNSVGKTRTLNVIDGLALNLAGLKPPPLSGTMDAEFTDEGKILRYQVRCDDEVVVEERFSVDGNVMLDRGRDGVGTIWASAIDGGKSVQFQTPPKQFAAVARRDSIQHSFLEPLYTWGSSVRHYLFGTPLGKQNLVVIVGKNTPLPNERDSDATVPLFRAADKEFGEKYREAIIQDMASVGYPLEAVGLSPLVSVRIQSNAPGELLGLYVKEKGLRGITDQASISQGMFRALALFVHINYCQFKNNATCLLIDDIGEGLDFERSCLLVDRLRQKTQDGLIQLVLATNDRFVMNRVPLEEWSVLQRRQSEVRVRNINNSKAAFEEFKFTGLSNFNFFEMDLLSEPGAVDENA